MPKSSRSERSKSRSDSRNQINDEKQENQLSNASLYSETCLYIGNIDKRFTEDKLRQLFQKHGELQYCYIVYQPFSSSQNYSKQIKMSRGYGFAKYKITEESIKARNQLNGYNINGREIKVQLSKRNRPREATPGRYLGRKRPSPQRNSRRQRKRSYSSSSSRSYRRREKNSKKHHRKRQRSRSRSRSFEKERYRRRRSYSKDRDYRH